MRIKSRVEEKCGSGGGWKRLVGAVCATSGISFEVFRSADHTRVNLQVANARHEGEVASVFRSWYLPCLPPTLTVSRAVQSLTHGSWAVAGVGRYELRLDQFVPKAVMDAKLQHLDEYLAKTYGAQLTINEMKKCPIVSSFAAVYAEPWNAAFAWIRSLRAAGLTEHAIALLGRYIAARVNYIYNWQTMSLQQAIEAAATDLCNLPRGALAEQKTGFHNLENLRQLIAHGFTESIPWSPVQYRASLCSLEGATRDLYSSRNSLAGGEAEMGGNRSYRTLPTPHALARRSVVTTQPVQAATLDRRASRSLYGDQTLATQPANSYQILPKAQSVHGASTSGRSVRSTSGRTSPTESVSAREALNAWLHRQKIPTGSLANGRRSQSVAGDEPHASEETRSVRSDRKGSIIAAPLINPRARPDRLIAAPLKMPAERLRVAEAPSRSPRMEEDRGRSLPQNLSPVGAALKRRTINTQAARATMQVAPVRQMSLAEEVEIQRRRMEQLAYKDEQEMRRRQQAQMEEEEAVKRHNAAKRGQAPMNRQVDPYRQQQAQRQAMEQAQNDEQEQPRRQVEEANRRDREALRQQAYEEHLQARRREATEAQRRQVLLRTPETQTQTQTRSSFVPEARESTLQRQTPRQQANSPEIQMLRAQVEKQKLDQHNAQQWRQETQRRPETGRDMQRSGNGEQQWQPLLPAQQRERVNDSRLEDPQEKQRQIYLRQREIQQQSHQRAERQREAQQVQRQRDQQDEDQSDTSFRIEHPQQAQRQKILREMGQAKETPQSPSPVPSNGGGLQESLKAEIARRFGIKQNENVMTSQGTLRRPPSKQQGVNARAYTEQTSLARRDSISPPDMSMFISDDDYRRRNGSSQPSDFLDASTTPSSHGAYSDLDDIYGAIRNPPQPRAEDKSRRFTYTETDL